MEIITVLLIDNYALWKEISSCNSRPVQFHTFLIPSNYEGALRIVYDEECGIKPRIEDGKEILEFPKNGILILNTDTYAETGNEYYLIDGKGNKTKVREIFNSADRLNNGPSVLAGYTYNGGLYLS